MHYGTRSRLGSLLSRAAEEAIDSYNIENYIGEQAVEYDHSTDVIEYRSAQLSYLTEEFIRELDQAFKEKVPARLALIAAELMVRFDHKDNDIQERDDRIDQLEKAIVRLVVDRKL